MENKIEIIIGTYEEFLIGYKLEQSKDEKFSLIQSFATRSHTASVRCVASNGRYVASGGADDRIFVYDMKTRREIQILTHHNGTVNAITFTPDGTHLLSGGDDGQMVAIRTNTWQTNAMWKKAHGGSAVTQITCHPSGKLALTLGNDLTLRTWNLIKGRTMYTTNLKNKKSLANSPDCISWSVDGNYFTVTGPRCIEIWSIHTAGMIKKHNCNSKPISVCWMTNDDVFVGLENGEIMMVSVKKNEEVKTFQAYQQRVKSICYHNGILATASSSGEICVWTVDMETKEIDKIASSNIGCRPTCLQILDLTQFGDDYKITNPEDELVVNTEENDKNQNSLKKQNIGSVKIEYDDDVDDRQEKDADEKVDTNLENSNQKKKKRKMKNNLQTQVEENVVASEVVVKKKKNNIKPQRDSSNSTISDKQNSSAISDSDSDDQNKHNFVRIRQPPVSKKTKKKKKKVLK